MPSLTEQQEADRDLDLFEMERAWASSQKRRTEVEWLVVFPEAKKRWGRIIKLGTKVEEIRLKGILNQYHQLIRLDIERHYKRKDDDGRFPPKVTSFGIDTVEWIKENGRNAVQEVERAIRKTKSDRKLLGEIGNINRAQRQSRVEITPAMIARAKEHPLEKLVEFNRQKFATCIWHDDKHASMFCKNNFAHCFSCGNSGDTIAVIQKLQGISFREAVLKLQ